MIHTSRSSRSLWKCSSPLTGSHRHLIQNATASSSSIAGRSTDDPNVEVIQSINSKTTEDRDAINIRIPKSAIYIVIASAALTTSLYLVLETRQNAKEAREKLFKTHSDDEWLAAIMAARQRDIDNGYLRMSSRRIVRKTAEETSGQGEVIDHVESLTGKERALLGAAITGEVETRYLGKERMYLTKEEREDIPLSERWEEEKRQAYWDWKADWPSSPLCVVM